MKIRDVMTRDVELVNPDTSLQEAARKNIVKPVRIYRVARSEPS